MRRPRRNIEVFSISVIDLLASALGAFILISIILFPFYNQHQQLEKTKTDLKVIAEETKKASEQKKKFQEVVFRQLEDIKQAVTAADGLELCKKQESACRAALGKTFLIIGIEWDERCDVDIFITDPRGNEFSYRAKNENFQNFKASKGQLSLDMLDGPGVEIWQNPEAENGLYRVNYSVHCKAGVEQVKVQGWVIDRSGGRRCFPETVMNPPVYGRQVAMLEVNTDGSTTIRPVANCPLS
jgi:hypothetical protein